VLSYDEVLSKLKAASRPLTIAFKGTVDPATMPKGTPPASPIVPEKTPTSSPGLSAGMSSLAIGSDVALPSTAGAATAGSGSAFNFDFSSLSKPAAAEAAPAASGGLTFDFSKAAAPAASTGFNFNFAPTATAGAPLFAASTEASTEDKPFSFNFGPITSTDGDDEDSDDDDDDDDDSDSEDDEDYDEDDDEDDDTWLFRCGEAMEVEELMEGFGMDEGEAVIELNPTKWKTLKDAADEVQDAMQKKAKKKKGKKGKGKPEPKPPPRIEGEPIEVLKQVFRPLCKKGMLLVAHMEGCKENGQAAKLVNQVCQCVDAMFEELAEEEEGGVVVGVLEQWEHEQIEGPSISEENCDVTLEVADLNDLDDDEEGGWVFNCEPMEEGYEELKDQFGIFDDDEPMYELDATEWTGLKSVVEAFRAATGKGAAPKKGGITKLLMSNLKPLCKKGMLLVIKNADADKPMEHAVVCQLLQVMENVFEELEDEMGKVLCVLPGWADQEITGPSLEDPAEFVSMSIQTIGGDPSMFEMDGNMSEEEMRAAMMKAFGAQEVDLSNVLEMGDMDGDGDDEDVEPASEAQVEAILGKIKAMQVAEQDGGKGKKGKKKKK